jgi:UDP-N-acetylglucosamine/UDP-N-acetylgalactosamine diphosphorylase
MTTAKPNAVELNSLRPALAAWHQEDVLRWWNELSPPQQVGLAEQIRSLDLPYLDELFRGFRDLEGRPPHPVCADVRPTPAIPLPQSADERRREQEAAQTGGRALGAGEVALVLVAGGQGSRLGFDGPKGMFPLGPRTGKTLFQVHAERVLAASQRYGVPLPLYIMTSPDTGAATRAYFAEQRCFGLEPGQVVLFQQGTMPSLDRHSGRLLLVDKGRLAASPDGHGGVLRALASGGHLARLREQGVRYLFYWHVDNPLVRVAEPAFVGQHIEAGAEMSLKVVRKQRPDERLGVVVQTDDGYRVIEYLELPKAMAERRTPDGGLEFWTGSIGVHVFAVSFLERLWVEGRRLPHHAVARKVPFLDEAGQVCKPAEPNAVKFESFIFDVLPWARRALVVETDRRLEFEPLKNATGDESPETVRRALAEIYGDWEAGLNLEATAYPQATPSRLP